MIFNDLPEQWCDLIGNMAEFEGLSAAVEQAYASGEVYPPKHLLFNALNLVSPQDVKVVIIGQDPYHQFGMAHGLAFSVPETMSIPQSLSHIFKELAYEFGASPTTKDLTFWAEQGVLLLNSALTVEANQANSHQKFGWKGFIKKLINRLAEERENIVFMLWGNDAMTICKDVDNKRHKILTATHPSGLSWGYTTKESSMRGHKLVVDEQGNIIVTNQIFTRRNDDSFYGCMHFTAANNFLKYNNIEPIKWI